MASHARDVSWDIDLGRSLTDILNNPDSCSTTAQCQSQTGRTDSACFNGVCYTASTSQCPQQQSTVSNTNTLVPNQIPAVFQQAALVVCCLSQEATTTSALLVLSACTTHATTPTTHPRAVLPELYAPLLPMVSLPAQSVHAVSHARQATWSTLLELLVCLILHPRQRKSVAKPAQSCAPREKPPAQLLDQQVSDLSSTHPTESRTLLTRLVGMSVSILVQIYSHAVDAPHWELATTARA